MRRKLPTPSDLGLVRVRRTRSGKRIRLGLSDGKTLSLYQSMLGLLAEKDFEAISVARIAKAGGCSVGAFYGRFSHKTEFLEFVIAETFRQMASRAGRAFDSEVAGGRGRSKVIRKIVEHISTEFSDAENAGVIRAAVKLGFSERRPREAFNEYREAVADFAANNMGSARIARSAINVVFGVCTGVIVTEEWPRKSDLSHMNDFLHEVTLQFAHSGEKSPSKPAARKPFEPGEEKISPQKSEKNHSEIPASVRRGGRKAL